MKLEIEKLYKDIYSLKQVFCPICHELWPSNDEKCEQCHKDPIKFSELNNMVPDLHSIPIEVIEQLEN